MSTFFEYDSAAPAAACASASVAATTSPQALFGPNLARFWGEKYSAGKWLEEARANSTAQATAGSQPTTSTINGHVTLVFDGTDDFISAPNFTDLDTKTSFCLWGCFKTSSSAGPQLIQKLNVLEVLMNGAGALQVATNGFAHSVNSSSSGWNNGVWHWWIFNVSAGAATLYIDTVGSNQGTTTSVSFAASATTWDFGANSGAFQFFPGEQAYVGAADRAATSPELTSLASYLSSVVVTNQDYPRSFNENVAAPTDAFVRSTVVSRPHAGNVAAPTDVFTRSNGVFSRPHAGSVAAPTDAFTRAGTFSRPHTGSVAAPTDAYARAGTFFRTLVESVAAPTDAWARSTVVARTWAETVSAPSDSFLRSYGATRSWSETLSAVSDAFTRIFVGARTLVESLSAPADVFGRQGTGARTFNESVAAPTDAFGRVFVGSRPLSGNIGAPTDGFTRSVSQSRPFTEALSAPGDAFTRSGAFSRPHAGSVAAPTDAFGRVFVGARLFNDSAAAPTDSWSRSVGTGPVNYPRSFNESVGAPSDAWGRSLGAVRSFPSTVVAPSDAWARSAGASTRPFNESVAAPTDAFTRSTTLSRTHTVSVAAPTDAFGRSTTFQRTFIEVVVAPTDAWGRSFGFARSFDENVAAPTDAYVRAVDFIRAWNENVARATDVWTYDTSLNGYGEIFLVAAGPYVTIAFALPPPLFTAIKLVESTAPLTAISVKSQGAEENEMIVGNVMKLDFNVKKDGALTDPGAVIVRAQSPSQRAADPTSFTEYAYGTDPEVTRRSLGMFRFLRTATEAGKWTFLLVTDEGGGVAEASGDCYIDVDPAPF